MLKPALARGELRCIGATTLDEYRKHVEKDAALERRFQPVSWCEPIPRGGHHRHPARPQGALRGAPRGAHPGRRPSSPPPTLSDRYITDRLPARQGHRPHRRGGLSGCASRSTDARRHRPTRAQASRLQLEIESTRRSPKEKRRRQSQGAPEARSRAEIAELKATRPARHPEGALGNEKESAIEPSQRAQEGEIESRPALRPSSDALSGPATARGAPPRSATASIPSSRRSSSRGPGASSSSCRPIGAMLSEEVTEEEVAEVVSAWTGIPVSRLLEGERREAAEDGGAPRTSGSSARTRLRARPSPTPCAGAGPACRIREPTDRLLPLPGTHRRGQDRAGQGAGRVLVRRREGHGAASTCPSTWRSTR